MVTSQIRANARESLTGKWHSALSLIVVYLLITIVIRVVLTFIPVIGDIAFLAVSTPLSFGLLVSFMKLKRGEDVSCTEFLNNGFSSFRKVWAVFGNMILKMIIPICLLIVFFILTYIAIGGEFLTCISAISLSSSMTTIINRIYGFGFLGIVGFIGFIASFIYLIVKGYLYSLSYYILNDNPDMSGKEIVEESARLMKGNRWRFFWLGLSFIGWAILTTFTFGIGMLWLMPYMMVAMICFYENLANKDTAEVVSEN